MAFFVGVLECILGVCGATSEEEYRFDQVWVSTLALPTCGTGTQLSKTASSFSLIQGVRKF